MTDGCGAPLIPPASRALREALEYLGGYQADFDAGELPALSEDGVLALAAIADAAMEALTEAGGDVPALRMRMYALANGLPVSSS